MTSIEFYWPLQISSKFLFSICLLLSLCSLLLLSCLLLSILLLDRILSGSLWLDRSANFCLMLLTFFFVDSLSNPLFIVTICVPKRRWKMIWVDYQMFMFCVPKVDGVENKEGRWKHSSKSKVASQVRLLLLPICVPSHNFFRNFFAKSFVVSIIFVTFAVSYPYWKLQLGEGGMDIYT